MIPYFEIENSFLEANHLMIWIISWSLLFSFIKLSPHIWYCVEFEHLVFGDVLCFSSLVIYYNWLLVWFFPDSTNFLNLIKENVVVAGVWLVIMSVVGSLHLGHCYPLVMAASLHLSLVRHHHHHSFSFTYQILLLTSGFMQD